MHFDELVLKIPGDELRVQFHPRVTVLSGLGTDERRAMTETMLGALTGGGEPTALRLVDGTGRTVHVLSGAGGSVQARFDDDTPAEPPLGALTSSPETLRALMLVEAADLGAAPRAARADEPRELRDARSSLQEITEQLEGVLGSAEHTAELQRQLDALDAELQAAHDGAARREYAQVLAQLERVRAEAATLQAGTAGVEADRQLLTQIGSIEALAARWTEVAGRQADALARLGPGERSDPETARSGATTPDEVPPDLEALVEAAVVAEIHRSALDHRLQALAVATLPAPSDPVVAELGLLDQAPLWRTAQRLIDASDEVQRVQVSLGGLGGEDGGAAPAVIEEMEAAHRDLEAAEQAAEAVRLPGVAGTGLGVTLALAGTIQLPLLIPLGLLIAGVVGTVTLLRPRRRVAQAGAAEGAALERAGAPSYLGFHLRRVDASTDPTVRTTLEAAGTDLRAAGAAWVELVGPDIDVRRAITLDGEVQAYHDALQNLGGAADEIEQLRKDLTERAEPALADARAGVAEACAPFGVSADAVDDPSLAMGLVTRSVEQGRWARQQLEVEVAEAAERAAADALDARLRPLGFDTGPVDARLGAFDWAASRAAEREQARADARSPAEIEGDLDRLQEAARRLRRPEWSTVTAAEAATPDIGDLEERRAKLVVDLTDVQPEIDVARLADRRAALERRVTALEARHGGHDGSGDPGAVADIQTHLLARLTKAGQAGPHGDAVPALLDEVFLRVPAERKWDLLDLLFRLSERHQLVYLSDDPFVAAWARQCPKGSVTLLEPEPEPA